MPTVRLTDRALVVIGGADAEHFLQNLVTTDLDQLSNDELKPGALLTPQGKILFDFLVSQRTDGSLQLDVRADIADDLMKRLGLYKLRAKVEISKRQSVVATIDWSHDSGSPEAASADGATWYADTRFRELSVRRSYDSSMEATDEPESWTALRIENGIAESGSDYALGDAFPHDVLLDENGGVGFKKGCYIGQEVVSRMQHRGTARRRVLILSSAIDLPRSGTPVVAAGREAGTLGSVLREKGLAVCRIDRIRNALDEAKPILAADVPVIPEIPAWANFSYPETDRSDSDAKSAVP